MFNRDTGKHFKSSNLPELDDDGLPITLTQSGTPVPAGPDVLSSVSGITLQAYLSPGPYSDAEKKRLLTAVDMLRDLIEERAASEPDLSRKGSSLRLTDVEKEA